MKIPNEVQRAIRALAVEQRPDAERLRKQALIDAREDAEELREQIAKVRDAKRVLEWARELVDSGALDEVPIRLPVYHVEETAVFVRPDGSLDVEHRGKLRSPRFLGVAKAGELVKVLSDEILGILVARIESEQIWRDVERLASPES